MMGVVSGRSATTSCLPSLLVQQPEHAGRPKKWQHITGLLPPMTLTCGVITTALLRISDEMDGVIDTKSKIDHLGVGDAFNLANQSDAVPSSGDCELQDAAQ
jgi:hypothetical protein